MIFLIPKEEVLKLVKKQLEAYFLVLSNEETSALESCFERSLVKCEFNFSHSENKYFSIVKDGEKEIKFDPFHSIQWMIFLYYLSHELYLIKSKLCDKVYYLNKIMHSVDLFYAVSLPDVFCAEHPLGSVMGRAEYGENFFFYQGCTVGGFHCKDGTIVYPTIGNNVRMFANSSILGNSHIGNNVKIGAGALIKNQDVPDGCVVFGSSPNIIIKQAK